jgi:succinate dehydrogenase / fumarate reductase, cytochrome b subunit
MTGAALSAGLLLIIYLLYALSQGETAYVTAQSLMNSWLGKSVYLAFVFALFFHLCHGIRHLFWDAGAGFGQDTLTKYALLELLAAVSLTLWAWYFV